MKFYRSFITIILFLLLFIINNKISITLIINLLLLFIL